MKLPATDSEPIVDSNPMWPPPSADDVTFLFPSLPKDVAEEIANSVQNDGLPPPQGGGHVKPFPWHLDEAKDQLYDLAKSHNEYIASAATLATINHKNVHNFDLKVRGMEGEVATVIGKYLHSLSLFSGEKKKQNGSWREALHQISLLLVKSVTLRSVRMGQVIRAEANPTNTEKGSTEVPPPFDDYAFGTAVEVEGGGADAKDDSNESSLAKVLEDSYYYARKHSRELKEYVKKLNSELAEGATPFEVPQLVSELSFDAASGGPTSDVPCAVCHFFFPLTTMQFVDGKCVSGKVTTAMQSKCRTCQAGSRFCEPCHRLMEVVNAAMTLAEKIIYIEATVVGMADSEGKSAQHLFVDSRLLTNEQQSQRIKSLLTYDTNAAVLLHKLALAMRTARAAFPHACHYIDPLTDFTESIEVIRSSTICNNAYLVEPLSARVSQEITKVGTNDNPPKEDTTVDSLSAAPAATTTVVSASETSALPSYPLHLPISVITTNVFRLYWDRPLLGVGVSNQSKIDPTDSSGAWKRSLAELTFSKPQTANEYTTWSPRLPNNLLPLDFSLQLTKEEADTTGHSTESVWWSSVNLKEVQEKIASDESELQVEPDVVAGANFRACGADLSPFQLPPDCPTASPIQWITYARFYERGVRPLRCELRSAILSQAVGQDSDGHKYLESTVIPYEFTSILSRMVALRSKSLPTEGGDSFLGDLSSRRNPNAPHWVAPNHEHIKPHPTLAHSGPTVFLSTVDSIFWYAGEASIAIEGCCAAGAYPHWPTGDMLGAMRLSGSSIAMIDKHVLGKFAEAATASMAEIATGKSDPTTIFPESMQSITIMAATTEEKQQIGRCHELAVLQGYLLVAHEKYASPLVTLKVVALQFFGTDADAQILTPFVNRFQEAGEVIERVALKEADGTELFPTHYNDDRLELMDLLLDLPRKCRIAQEKASQATKQNVKPSTRTEKSPANEFNPRRFARKFTIIFTSGTSGGNPKGAAFDEVMWQLENIRVQDKAGILLCLHAPCWATDKMTYWLAFTGGSQVGFTESVIPLVTKAISNINNDNNSGAGVDGSANSNAKTALTSAKQTTFSAFATFRPSPEGILVPVLVQQLRGEFFGVRDWFLEQEERELLAIGKHKNTITKSSEKANRAIALARASAKASFVIFRHFLGGKYERLGLGGAAVPPDLAIFMQELIAPTIRNSYGATECGAMLVDGKPVKGVEVKLIDRPELGFTTNDLPFPRGEIAIRNKNGVIQHGDWVCDDATSSSLKQRYIDEGYILTGDIVMKVGEDQYVLIDRASSVQKLANGKFFSPEVIEETVMLHFSKQKMETKSGHQSAATTESTPIKEVENPIVGILVAASKDKQEIIALLRFAMPLIGPHKIPVMTHAYYLREIRKACKQGGGVVPVDDVPTRVYFDQEVEGWTAENRCLTPSLKVNRTIVTRTRLEKALAMEDGQQSVGSDSRHHQSKEGDHDTDSDGEGNEEEDDDYTKSFERSLLTYLEIVAGSILRDSSAAEEPSEELSHLLAACILVSVVPSVTDDVALESASTISKAIATSTPTATTATSAAELLSAFNARLPLDSTFASVGCDSLTGSRARSVLKLLEKRIAKMLSRKLALPLLANLIFFKEYELTFPRLLKTTPIALARLASARLLTELSQVHAQDKPEDSQVSAIPKDETEKKLIIDGTVVDASSPTPKSESPASPPPSVSPQPPASQAKESQGVALLPLWQKMESNIRVMVQEGLASATARLRNVPVCSQTQHTNNSSTVPTAFPSGHVTVLTGATGFAGVTILRQLLLQASYSETKGRVYCLVRPPTNVLSENSDLLLSPSVVSATLHRLRHTFERSLEGWDTSTTPITEANAQSRYQRVTKGARSALPATYTAYPERYSQATISECGSRSGRTSADLLALFDALVTVIPITELGAVRFGLSIEAYHTAFIAEVLSSSYQSAVSPPLPITVINCAAAVKHWSLSTAAVESCGPTNCIGALAAGLLGVDLAVADLLQEQQHFLDAAPPVPSSKTRVAVIHISTIAASLRRFSYRCLPAKWLSGEVKTGVDGRYTVAEEARAWLDSLGDTYTATKLLGEVALCHLGECLWEGFEGATSTGNPIRDMLLRPLTVPEATNDDATEHDASCSRHGSRLSISIVRSPMLTWDTQTGFGNTEDWICRLIDSSMPTIESSTTSSGLGLGMAPLTPPILNHCGDIKFLPVDAFADYILSHVRAEQLYANENYADEQLRLAAAQANLAPEGEGQPSSSPTKQKQQQPSSVFSVSPSVMISRRVSALAQDQRREAKRRLREAEERDAAAHSTDAPAAAAATSEVVEPSEAPSQPFAVGSHLLLGFTQPIDMPMFMGKVFERIGSLISKSSITRHRTTEETLADMMLASQQLHPFLALPSYAVNFGLSSIAELLPTRYHPAHPFHFVNRSHRKRVEDKGNPVAGEVPEGYVEDDDYYAEVPFPLRYPSQSSCSTWSSPQENCKGIYGESFEETSSRSNWEYPLETYLRRRFAL